MRSVTSSPASLRMFCTRLTNSRAKPSFTSSGVRVVSRATVSPSTESTSQPSMLCAEIVTSSRTMVTGVPFTSVENVPVRSSSMTSARGHLLNPFRDGIDLLAELGTDDLEIRGRRLSNNRRRLVDEFDRLTLISSRMTSFICSMRRRVSAEAGTAIRESGCRVFRFVFARMERTRPTTRCATSMRLSSSVLMSSFRLQPSARYEPTRRFAMRLGHQRAIDFIRKKRRHRRGHLRDRDQAFEESLVSRCLILARFALPEASPIATDIPVRKLLDCEVAHQTCGPCRIVGIHGLDVFGDGAVEDRKYPSIDIGTLRRPEYRVRDV